MKAEFSRLNKLAMAVPRLKQSTRLAEKQEKEKAVRLQQLQSEPAEPSKGKGQGNFYFMNNHILLALLVLFLLDVYLQSNGSLSGKRSRTATDMQPKLKVQRLQMVTSPRKSHSNWWKVTIDALIQFHCRSVDHRKETVPYNFPFL